MTIDPFEDDNFFLMNEEGYRNDKENNLQDTADERKFKCDQCDHAAYTKYNLANHKLFKHSEERPFPCDQCEYQAKTISSLNLHKKTHIADRKFKCPQCPKAYTTNANLTIHVRSHTGEKTGYQHHLFLSQN